MKKTTSKERPDDNRKEQADQQLMALYKCVEIDSTSQPPYTMFSLRTKTMTYASITLC